MIEEIMGKKLLHSLLFIFLFGLTAALCHRATDGFALVNIKTPCYPASSFPLSEAKLPSDLNLDSPFTYFASGSQSYVFLSSDGSMVLKLFKFEHMRIPPWLDLLPLPEPLNRLRREKKRKKQEVFEATLRSNQIAYEKFRSETGLLYVHLSESNNLKKEVVIVDKIGNLHKINLDKTLFILQKKGELVYPCIDEWVKKGELEKAKEGIHTLLELALLRCQKGIFDKDPDFSTNFAFIGERAIQIDFGRFTLDKEEKDPEVYLPEMIRITRAFEKWIQKSHPELLPFLEQELELIQKKERP
jgi:hypothetical protein